MGGIGMIVRNVWWQREKDVDSGMVCLFGLLILLQNSDTKTPTTERYYFFSEDSRVIDG